jgi:hypothetical protein
MLAQPIVYTPVHPIFSALVALFSPACVYPVLPNRTHARHAHFTLLTHSLPSSLLVSERCAHRSMGISASLVRPRRWSTPSLFRRPWQQPPSTIAGA